MIPKKQLQLTSKQIKNPLKSHFLFLLYAKNKIFFFPCFKALLELHFGRTKLAVLCS